MHQLRACCDSFINTLADRVWVVLENAHNCYQFLNIPTFLLVLYNKSTIKEFVIIVRPKYFLKIRLYTFEICVSGYGVNR